MGRRNIAANFNRLMSSRMHERYRQTTDRQTYGQLHIVTKKAKNAELPSPNFHDFKNAIFD